MSDERFLIRVTGKGVSFKRRVPGWLTAWLIRVAVENDPKEERPGECEETR